MPEGTADQPPSKIVSPREARPRIETPAQTAFRLFMDASIKCPNSVTAQGAVIALATRQTGANPESLSEALLANKAKLEAIRRAALNQHKDNRVGPRNEDALPMQKVKNTIASSFRWARELDPLIDDQLREIIDRVFPLFAYDREEISNVDDSVAIIVNRMLHDAAKAAGEKAA